MPKKIQIPNSYESKTKKGISWKKTAENIYLELQKERELRQEEKQSSKVDQTNNNIKKRIQDRIEDGDDIYLYSLQNNTPETRNVLCDGILEMKEWKYNTPMLISTIDGYHVFDNCEQIKKSDKSKPNDDEPDLIDIMDEFISSTKSVHSSGDDLIGESEKALDHLRKKLPKEKYTKILEQLEKPKDEYRKLFNKE